MAHPFPGTRALHTFEAAGRHLNFTAAGAEVGLTPAAVSHQIREMEGRLGYRLFRRTSRRMQLTPAGAVLHEAVAEALSTLRHAAVRAKRRTRGESSLRVSVGPRFAANWLLPRLERFRAAHPALELTFDITDAVRDFRADDIDIAIRFGPGAREGIGADRLFAATVVPVCSRAVFEAGAPPRTPRDLLSRTLCHVDCVVDGAVWPNWPMWMAAAGVEGLDASRCLAFADTGHVIAAVIEGGAVGLVERDMVLKELAEGRLVQLFDIGLTVGRNHAYHVVYPPEAADDPAVAALRTWLSFEAAAARAGEHPSPA